MRFRHLTICIVMALAAGAMVLGLTAFNRNEVQDQVEPDAGAPTAAQLAYGIGFYLGEEVRANLEADEVEADPDVLIRGFTHGLKQLDPEFDPEVLDQLLQEVDQTMRERAVRRYLEEDAEFRKLHDENLAAAKEFMDQFAARPGVQRLDNGVCYQVIVEGDGPIPAVDDIIIVSYQAALANGEVIDSRVSREFVIADMLEGPKSAALRMPVGSGWRIAIPPELAFGAFGDPPAVGPNEVILIEAELHGIKEQSP